VPKTSDILIVHAKEMGSMLENALNKSTDECLPPSVRDKMIYVADHLSDALLLMHKVIGKAILEDEG
jgi:hypothetical protein